VFAAEQTSFVLVVRTGHVRLVAVGAASLRLGGSYLAGLRRNGAGFLESSGEPSVGSVLHVARRWTSQTVVVMRSRESASTQVPSIHWNGQNRLAGWYVVSWV
jgi:hypothetical protein